MLEGKKAYIFDLDGTLLDSMGVWEEVDRIFLTRRNLPFDSTYLQELSALGLVRAADYTVEYFGLDEKPEDLIDEWIELAKEDYAYHIPAKPGVVEFLKTERAKGKKMAIATASDRDMFLSTLKRLDIEDCFDTIVTVPEIKKDKTTPAIYEEAARQLGVTPDETIVFEDLLLAVESAKRGGFTTIAVLDERTCDVFEDLYKAADHWVNDFTELL